MALCSFLIDPHVAAEVAALLPVWPLGASGTHCHFLATLEAINIILLRTLNAEMQGPLEPSGTPPGHSTRRFSRRDTIASAGLRFPGLLAHPVVSILQASSFRGARRWGLYLQGPGHLLPSLTPPLPSPGPIMRKYPHLRGAFIS